MQVLPSSGNSSLGRPYLSAARKPAEPVSLDSDENIAWLTVPFVLNPSETPAFLEKLGKTAQKLMNSGVEKPTIGLYINCTGGSDLQLRSVVDTIEAMKNSGITIATRAVCAHSAGGILLSLGSPGHRTISPHGRVVIHESRTTGLKGQQAPQFAHEFRAHATSLKESTRYAHQLLSDNSQGKLSEETLTQKTGMGANWCLTADEAVRYGLADRIE
jgi:ATP-dependent protease ClpP protease subunit